MKVTIDMDTFEVTVPKNFFTYYEKINAANEKAGLADAKIKPIELLKKAFNTAMADTDKYLHVKG